MVLSRDYSLFRLQGYVLFYYVLDARTGFVGVEVVMTYDHGAGVALVQVFEQLSHRHFLRLGTRVGRITPDIKPTLVADAYRVGIVVLAVGTNQPFRPTLFYTSVTTDHVVVADAEVETSLAMPRINLGGRTHLVGLYCRTMNHNQGYSAHAWTKKVDAISDPTATRNLIILPTVFLLNFIILLSNFKSL